MDTGKAALQHSALFPLTGIGENEEFHTLLRAKEIETIHSGETSMETSSSR